MSRTQKRWTQEHSAVATQLEPYTTSYGDGFVGIDPMKNPPVRLLDLYRDLTSIGYANGWIA